MTSENLTTNVTSTEVDDEEFNKFLEEVIL